MFHSYVSLLERIRGFHVQTKWLHPRWCILEGLMPISWRLGRASHLQRAGPEYIRDGLHGYTMATGQRSAFKSDTWMEKDTSVGDLTESFKYDFQVMSAKQKGFTIQNVIIFMGGLWHCFANI